MMPEYRRAFVPGGCFFFTIVTNDRQPFLLDPGSRQNLKAAIQKVRTERPFDILASVLLPEHFHCIWQLPEGDSDYSKRWSLIKRHFCGPVKIGPELSSPSRKAKRERNIWQRRFWEHTIRDENDLRNHIHYIHYNPVKHGHARCPHEWEYSSFHLWVKRDVIDITWGCQCEHTWTPPKSFERMECGDL